MNAQERIRDLECRYKRYLLKRILRFLLIFFILIICAHLLLLSVQYYYKQRSLSLKNQEYKKQLNYYITQTKILYEKNKILQERFEQEDQVEEERVEELKTQMNIHSRILKIADLKRNFYQNPSYEKAMNLAKQYYRDEDYEKCIFWTLKANDMDRKRSDSWILFARAKKALGKESEAKQALDIYVSYFGLIELDRYMDD